MNEAPLQCARRSPTWPERSAVFISQEVFINLFCKRHFPHKSLDLFFILAIVEEKVDGFVRELTFAKRLYEHFLRDKIPSEEGSTCKVLRTSPVNGSSQGQNLALTVVYVRKRSDQPSEGVQILFFNCLHVCHQSPDSGERHYKSRTWKRRFDPVLRAIGPDHQTLNPNPSPQANRSKPRIIKPPQPSTLNPKPKPEPEPKPNPPNPNPGPNPNPNLTPQTRLPTLKAREVFMDKLLV